MRHSSLLIHGKWSRHNISSWFKELDLYRWVFSHNASYSVAFWLKVGATQAAQLVCNYLQSVHQLKNWMQPLFLVARKGAYRRILTLVWLSDEVVTFWKNFVLFKLKTLKQQNNMFHWVVSADCLSAQFQVLTCIIYISPESYLHYPPVPT